MLVFSFVVIYDKSSLHYSRPALFAFFTQPAPLQQLPWVATIAPMQQKSIHTTDTTEQKLQNSRCNSIMLFWLSYFILLISLFSEHTTIHIPRRSCSPSFPCILANWCFSGEGGQHKNKEKQSLLWEYIGVFLPCHKKHQIKILIFPGNMFDILRKKITEHNLL